MHSRNQATESNPKATPMIEIPTAEGSGDLRILVVTDDDSFVEQLSQAFGKDGFLIEHVRSITGACKRVRSGQFPVVLSTPILRDGCWKDLVDFATYEDPSFVVVLLAPRDFQERDSALEYGAFDVLNIPEEMSRVRESVTHAVWAAYLIGDGLFH
jgi:DNA-binding NtrC family response regulator